MKKKRVRHQKFPLFSILFHKPLLFIFLLILLPILVWGIQQTQQMISFGKNSAKKIQLSQSSSCPTTSGNSYGTIDPIDKYPSGDPPAELHPDLNITAIRGFVPSTGEKYPLVLGEGGDPKAPQIWRITDKIPEIVSLYRVNFWDWKTNTKGPPMPLPDDPAASVKQISMIGLATTPGETIRVPYSGYIIGGDYQVMVIFANENNITVKYGREDNIGIKFGYAIQIDGVCVDPNLLQLYRQLNAVGRNDLPAVEGGKAIGVAQGNEIRVVIRDTGDFLDPRSKLDWWQTDYPYTSPTNPPTVKPTSPPKPTTPPIPTIVPSTPLLPSPTPLPQIQPSPTNTPVTIPSTPPSTIIIYVTPTLTVPTNTPTSIPTPTVAPIIDFPKTINNARSTLTVIITSIKTFLLTILP